ncbi:sulfur oxidation protein SoxY [Sulfurimonas gotlandica GD1]|uniref:Sulfur oxidation protein SoxY n=1 Tax=Sulfurimonas gotlandica (strain DSM 19862 / JCM 16533 / GD1) TaxID=929558 RepID=B6BLD4_SULGG|nr:thiosulfate oxidation carrier protein SoxY [Sulfurimonas gotlandica]EDZ62047.1 twin-arginine translocation pathway signal [Sulfurimonas gotlandica GD1]EHP28588.1 sulfur oxidation protein SoxY [Sulfurimonas gotlandica GD1]
MQRREFFKKLGAVAAVAAVTPSISFAAEAKKPTGPNELSFKAAVDAITGGKTPVISSKITLKVPEIAENGAVVPVTVEVDSPMTDADYVKAIHIFATKNNNSRCIDVHLTPANGKAMFATRIKLGGTQDVATVVELSDGTFLTASQNVKVTIGGCG